VLREQWAYWRKTEMRWLDQKRIPLYMSTSNHNTYDYGSEEVFREVHPELPRNGPPGQEGLAYFIRRGSLLYVSTHQPDRLWVKDGSQAPEGVESSLFPSHAPNEPRGTGPRPTVN